jgi:putative holliday junction resolvase
MRCPVNQAMPSGTTYLCFDFGTKRIGVAVGQDITKSASPLPCLHTKQGVPDWDAISALIASWRPSGLVVGIPLNLDDRAQPITRKARAFAKELETRYALPVYHVDERLTTKEARSRVFAAGGYKALQKEPIDSIAAKLMLEEWLSG